MPNETVQKSVLHFTNVLSHASTLKADILSICLVNTYYL